MSAFLAALDAAPRWAMLALAGAALVAVMWCAWTVERLARALTRWQHFHDRHLDEQRWMWREGHPPHNKEHHNGP